jgi:hypothetical protein
MDGSSLKYHATDFQTPSTMSITAQSVKDAIICCILERGNFIHPLYQASSMRLLPLNYDRRRGVERLDDFRIPQPSATPSSARRSPPSRSRA